MNYRLHYDRLMNRARSRTLSGYSERHHVVPRCMGGSNAADNLVRLTPEEHYVAHQLLVKMYPDNRSLLWAASNMTGKNRIMQRNNKLYGWIRRKLAEDTRARCKGKKLPPEQVERARLGHIGLKWGFHSAETKAKMSAAKKGRNFSDEHRAALAAAKLGKKRGPHSPEHCAKLAESNRKAALSRDNSVYRTEAYRELQSRKAKEAWKDRV